VTPRKLEDERIDMDFKSLGLNEWFQERLREFPPSDHSLARVTGVYKDNFRVRDQDKEIPAEITGQMLYGAASNLDLPVVGDWVQVQFFNNETLAVIHSFLPRKSLLKRKVAGKRIEYQALASNIDTAFIVQAAKFDFNIRRLERYLTIVNDAEIDPVILLSKTDLVTPEELSREIAEIAHSNPGNKTIPFSNKSGEGLDSIDRWIRRGRTYCLLGSSGVGKTTLINRLIGKEVYPTGGIRETDGRGRHITAFRQLIVLEQGGMIIDTPGLREIGMIGAEKGLKETFPEIERLAYQCRFKDCTHTNEPGCAVKEAVRIRELPEKRYQNYIKIRKESKYYQMSYLEKRRKDKAFGKMVKSVMKDKKKHTNE
jgi:ribosome biogenesis GTPase